MSGPQSLNLDSVTKSFDEAARVLDGLQTKLQSISSVETIAVRGSGSIDNAAEAIDRLLKTMTEAVGQLAHAQDLTKSAMEKAVAALADKRGEEIEKKLNALRAEQSTKLSELAEKLEESNRKVGTQVAAEIEALNTKLEDAMQAQVAAEASRAELERVKGALSARQKRKLGLEK